MAEPKRSTAMRKALRMTEADYIVAAYPERCAGPGWANRPVWVVVQRDNGPCRIECLQPAEQPPEIMPLLDIAEATHRAFVGAIRRAAGDTR